MYIRTKDGVYEMTNGREIVERWDIADNPHLIEYEYNHCTEENDEYDLGVFIAQSENLTELCDLFIGELDGKKVVLEKWNGNKFVIRWTVNMVSMIKDLNKTYANVKGAIYTDKGLIYVAKMDSEGKLVLI